jgi:dihydrofolate reductase
MEITLAMVMSADGKTTRGNDPNIYSWTSVEDQRHFFALRDSYNVIIMGRKTFEAARHVIKLSPQTLRLVVTSTPERFESEAVPEQLEFVDNEPSKVVASLEARGYSRALLVGGQQLNAAFVRANLINHLVLTVEPIMLGEGNTLFGEEALDVKLALDSVEKLNEKGTLLFKYTVL